MDWQQVSALARKQYICGHPGCGSLVGPDRGYYAANVPANPRTAQPSEVAVYLCSYCEQPTYFFDERQVPGAPYGNAVEGLPDDVGSLYQQARDAFAVEAYTSSVLTCRKLLMNVAVSQGAREGETFIGYVQYLADSGYVPPHGQGWVDHIRQRGNEANHEIRLMTKGDAEELIAFVEMLLKFIYEFPARVPGATGGAAAGPTS
jgi:hypothetical protein